MRITGISAVTFALLFSAVNANAQETLKPFKDRLFAYPQTLEERDGGAYLKVDYRELRDINERDAVPERRAKRQYVDLAGRRATKPAQLETLAGALNYQYAGKTSNARFITIYIHGKGGNAKQGVNDHSFGGNFNRIKMLMLKNNGLYLSPDAGDFTTSDIAKIEALIGQAAANSPSAKIMLACGSAGGAVCYALADQNNIAQRLSGIALLGSFWNDALFASAADKRKVPLYIAHGSHDTVFDIQQVESFYARARSNGLPVRMVRFETGTHGTPIRMIDWRAAINWMLSQ
ncbi:CocE/NonD family hydrolase [Ahrensia kielensis]|uniref:CocE/NonD family hydrolase n=1 Tax=Ahrensia kielensis TaxID=76980 RepID=A0ABU9T3V8_9HYPH